MHTGSTPRTAAAVSLSRGTLVLNLGILSIIFDLILIMFGVTEMRACSCRACHSLWELMGLMDVAISHEFTTSPRAKLLIITDRSVVTNSRRNLELSRTSRINYEK